MPAALGAATGSRQAALGSTLGRRACKQKVEGGNRGITHSRAFWVGQVNWLEFLKSVLAPEWHAGWDWSNTK